MRRWRPRSEYDHALNLARKARRRGDVKSAEHWLKHADRLLVIDHHRESFLHTENMRDAEMTLLRHLDGGMSKDIRKLQQASAWYRREEELAQEQERIDRYFEANFRKGKE